MSLGQSLELLVKRFRIADGGQFVERAAEV
jgi:hypothetical protein